MSEKKLWNVTLETEVVVVAETYGEAIDAAKEARRDIYDFDMHASEMTYLPGDWDEISIPFGKGDESDPDRTIKSWVKAGAAPAYKAATKMARST